MNKQAITLFKQRGFVLFMALIALVVMSLAAVALIRSVDTNTIIAGNLSLKQSALISSDRGVETALGWIEAKAIASPADLEVNSVANANNGYYATYLPPDAPDLDNPAVLKDDATWVAGASADATGAGIAAGTEAASKNNIRYIIQRMCRVAVPPVADKCLFGDTEVGTGSKGVKDATEAGAIIDAKQSPMYRVTLRVDGPKNTTSYTQTYVY
jgi:Tfp pilus assembly protein PilX